MTSVAAVKTGVAVLSSHFPDDDDDDDLPLNVRGVALGENDLTRGQSERYIHWPRDILESSAEALVGTPIVDDSAHDVPEGGDATNIPKEPPVESIRGEITSAHYEPGVGVVFEGEVDDERAASLVENDRVDVSPFVFHTSQENEETGVNDVTGIVKWRDVALVSNGASDGASISPADEGNAPTANAAAMSAAALSAVLDVSFDEADAEALASHDHLEYSGTSTGKLDEAAISSEGFESHYLFPDDTKSDSSYPVVDASSNLRRGNVESAWNLRGDAPISEGDMADIILELSSEFENPPLVEEDVEALESADSTGTTGAETGDGPESPEDPSNEGVEDNTMELEDDEKSIIHKIRSMDEATVVDPETESLAKTAEEFNLSDYEDPVVLESDEYETETEALSQVEDMLTDQLVDQHEYRPSKAAALSFEEKLEEFENEDGEFEAEALAQIPETGSTGDGQNEPEPDAEALEEANDLSREVLSLPDVQEMEAEGLEAHEYIEREHDVDPTEYSTPRSLQSAVNEDEN